MSESKRIAIVWVCIICIYSISAQASSSKRVYNEAINPIEQIDNALLQARNENKFVLCQIGGNWCPWCLRLTDFIENDSTIYKLISDNFIYIHVYYNPHTDTPQKAEQINAAMHRLGNPTRFGFPVIVILDTNGTIIHTQDTALLEEGKGYNRKKVARFLKCWTPSTVSRK